MAAHQAPRPWDSPGKNTGVGCHFLLQCMKGRSESEVAQSCPTLSDPMDCAAFQAPLSMGFSRQELVINSVILWYHSFIHLISLLSGGIKYGRNLWHCYWTQVWLFPNKEVGEKESLLYFGCWQWEVENACPKADSPPPIRGKSFYRQREGLHAETAQSALTVILVISGLVGVIFIVLRTVSLPFQDWLVPVSLRPVIGIVRLCCGYSLVIV